MERKLGDICYLVDHEVRNGRTQYKKPEIVESEISAIRKDGSVMIDQHPKSFDAWFGQETWGIELFEKKEDAVRIILDRKKKEFDELVKLLLEDHPEPTKRMLANFRLNLL